MGPSRCSMYDREDSHSLPSPTSKIATAYATTPLALQLPPRSNPPIFKRTDGMIPQVSWCAVQNHLCLVMDVQIVVNQRQEKKEWLMGPWCWHHSQLESVLKSILSKCSYPRFLLVSICMEYIFPSLHFSVCVYSYIWSESLVGIT